MASFSSSHAAGGPPSDSPSHAAGRPSFDSSNMVGGITLDVDGASSSGDGNMANRAIGLSRWNMASLAMGLAEATTLHTTADGKDDASGDGLERKKGEAHPDNIIMLGVDVPEESDSESGDSESSGPRWANFTPTNMEWPSLEEEARLLQVARELEKMLLENFIAEGDALFRLAG